MSVDIRKQLDLHPYSDKNVVQKPVVQTQPQVQPPADEEKSNAAKWMIGLTATAAIVLGGLYAAKHGHLGKNAEKFAKKLFGESVNETKAGNTAASTGATKPPSIAPALAFVTPALVRGKIKNPKLKLNDFIQELEKSNFSFKKFENIDSIPGTHIKLSSGEGIEPWTFRFDPDGVLSSIRKTISETEETVYRFENNVLSRIERTIQSGIPDKPLKHIVEFTENGKFKSKFFEINDGFKNLPVNSKAFSAFKPAEFVEAYIPRTSSFFKYAVDDLNTVQRSLNRTGSGNSSITIDNILAPIRKTYENSEKLKVMPKEKLTRALELVLNDEKFAAPIAKLIEQDMGDAKGVSTKTLAYLVENYSSKLKALGIKKPEQFEAVAKPLNKCSKKDFIALLGSRDAVHKKLPGCFDDYGMLDVEYLSSLPGFSHVKNNMTPFDILQDLAK